MDFVGHKISSRYEILAKIQSGFFGSTWKALDAHKKRSVCIKTFFSESESQRRELAVLKELCYGHFKHENLCRVLDVCLERASVTTAMGYLVTKIPYVVFEYCSGSDLFNFLVTGPIERNQKVSNFPEPLSRHYFIQMLMAIMYLHERGVFHRDIKPENCVLDKHFNLKLTDFGTNKFLPSSSDPAQVLRTSTRGVGTDSYRAPEVNGCHSYDPSAADVWSLGITLFFMSAIEEMVERVNTLDPYTRDFYAPLGMVFPFPRYCSKLDSYMLPEGVATSLLTASRDRSLPNDKFWLEWPSVTFRLSPNLKNLFNRIFVLVPSLRCTVRDMVHHSWLSTRTKMSPEEILYHMKERSPSGISTSKKASPRVVSRQMVGGVDQASLRASLSSPKRSEEIMYLADAELWVWSDQVKELESIQLYIIRCDDIQEIMIDISFSQQLLRDILSSPHEQRRRILSVQEVRERVWVPRFLHTLGFLPTDGGALILTDDALDLSLLHFALCLLSALELAISKSVIPIHTSSSPEEEMDMDFESEEIFAPSTESHDHHTTIRESVTFRGRSSSNPESLVHQVAAKNQTGLAVLTSSGAQCQSLSTSVPSDSSTADRILEHQGDSQDSQWSYYTAGSISTQSSQEYCPDEMMGTGSQGAGSEDSHAHHKLIDLQSCVKLGEPNKYKAAAEFCKLSGLLCSYGLYQIVCHEQLALCCRGNTTSFSARVMALDCSGRICISSWCLAGSEEWSAILDRLSRDMTPRRHSQ